LVVGVQRPAVDLRRPRRLRVDHAGRPQLGDRVREVVPDPDLERRLDLDDDLLDDGGHRRRADAQRQRQRPLRPHVRHRPCDAVRLLPLGVPGLRHDHDGLDAALAGPAGDVVLERELVARPRERRGREHRHALVVGVQRPAVDLRRPRRNRHDLAGRPQLGDRLCEVVPDPDLERRVDLDDDLLDHHRHRRRADAQRQRQRPLRAHVRHGAGGGGTCTQSDTPDFGPNVHIFDTSMSTTTIQNQLNTDFNNQKDTNTAQFGTGRVAELFKPGTYAVEANVGYYESVAGLGQNPDDVMINGDVTVDAFNSEDAGNATQNFWRSAENLAITPSSGTDRWAVAQAGPFRRIDVHGNLSLAPASNGYASGGYISDTKVSGSVSSVSQQQWYSKDSSFGSWNGGVWNMVFSGVTGAPAQSFPNP